MSLASAFGFGDGKKVRYAVVGLGDIAQSAMMPGIAHTGNSELVALVSGERDKAQAVADRYDVEGVYTYDEFDRLIASGTIDAIYLATPNWRHAEFAIPALNAGIHVLCEKPLEVSVEKAEAMRAAAAASGARLMTAYRLHFEPATLDAIARIRAGELGQLIAFTSCFGQMADPENHRVKNGIEAGPLFDMAPYPINATRYLFGDEPEEVVAAVGTRHPESGFPQDFDDTIAVTLRFPGNRLAQFTVSYFANNIDSYIIAGTKGSIHMSPGYGWQSALEQNRTVGDTQTHEAFKHTDHFGGQMRYFSACILEGRDPEPDGEEGIADLRVIEGIVRALKTGQPQKLPPFARTRRIDPDQVETLRAKSAPEPIGASSPTR
ncbi:Gfo/Idh/MocA family oxidoreductase [Sphingomonas sp. KR1UV-12]|uniref:Gfo/Idh/MocA family oxidoreductase n=1 Tax=Sphingomonas aurea TaxID=3063994 RepID=A0ABT9EML4_9SPHN|nr:Gfo/Idh/MocA family oxidoreductase [Sphingomonas sp. KR1UV-12]MDP1027893.1 Gfo/Idh/MocA family oxidoreductase [Sphingomonas sp. KR1UV-12]